MVTEVIFGASAESGSPPQTFLLQYYRVIEEVIRILQTQIVLHSLH